jgi:anti-anti-sigma regulatory factor
MPMRSLMVPTLLVGPAGAQLARDVRAAFDAGEQEVALEFSGNAYTDENGVLSLMGLGRDARRTGGSLVLRNVPRSLSRSLALSGLDTLFRMEIMPPVRATA